MGGFRVTATKKLGRPRDGEERETLTSITFKADAETKAALERLVEEGVAAAMPLVGLKSTMIRRAIVAFDRVREQGLSSKEKKR